MNTTNGSQGANERFTQTQRQIVRICEVIHAMPLEEFMLDLFRAEKDAPSSNPKEWEKAKVGFERMKAQAEALLVVKAVRAKVRERFLPTVNEANEQSAAAWLATL